MRTEQESSLPSVNKIGGGCFIKAIIAFALVYSIGYGIDSDLKHSGNFEPNETPGLAPNAMAYDFPHIPRTVVPRPMSEIYLTPVPGEVESHVTHEFINWIKEFENHPDISNEFKLYLGMKHQEISQLMSEGRYKVVVEDERKVASVSLYFVSHILDPGENSSEGDEVLVYKMNLGDLPSSNLQPAAHESCHVFFRSLAYRGYPAVYDDVGEPLKFDEHNFHNYIEEEYVCIAVDSLTSYYYDEAAAQLDDESFEKYGMRFREIASVLDINGMLIKIDSDSFFSVGNLFGILTDYSFYTIRQRIYVLDGILENDQEESRDRMLHFRKRLGNRVLSPIEMLYLENFSYNGLISSDVYQSILELTAVK